MKRTNLKRVYVTNAQVQWRRCNRKDMEWRMKNNEDEKYDLRENARLYSLLKKGRTKREREKLGT